MKILLYCSLLVLAWILFAQLFMKFRIPDKTARKRFSAVDVPLFTGTIHTGNEKLHYAQTGNDPMPTLFFVHGSPGSWMKFGKYLQDKDLLKKFRMVSIDRPGFGYSRFGNVKSLQEQSRIISALLIRLQNGKPLYAIGHSYGGPLIVQLASDNPGLFSGLVLLAASLDPAAEKPEKWRPVLFRTPLNYFIPGAWRPSNKELWYLKEDLKKLVPCFSTITCPVYIMHGGKDGLVPVSNAGYAQKMLLNARSLTVTIIRDANHFIADNNYQLVKEILLKLY
jgi:pimeloyl-ACP methyl ester carboxylesterase